MVDELKTLIILQLKRVFKGIKVYDTPIKQGLKTPAFLVRIFNTHQERQLKGQVKRTYSVSLVYFPESDEIENECDSVMEQIQDEFQYIANKHHVHELDGEVIDETLVVTFQIRVQLIKKQDGTKMKTLGGIAFGKDVSTGKQN